MLTESQKELIRELKNLVEERNRLEDELVQEKQKNVVLTQKVQRLETITENALEDLILHEANSNLKDEYEEYGRKFK